MPVVVTLTLNDKTVLVEADKVDKDPYLDANLLLFGTKGLSVPAPDGTSFTTMVWSVPKAQVKFYAIGRREAPPVPVVEAPAEAGLKLVTEMPEFVREAGEVLERDRGGRKKKPTPPQPKGEVSETSA
jgi:hypothetical protein